MPILPTVPAPPEDEDQALVAAALADQPVANLIQPPAPAPSDLTVPQLAAAAIPAAPAFPDNAVDAAIAAAPASVPAVSPAVTPPPGTPAAAMAADAEERRKLGVETVANAEEKARLDTEKATAEAEEKKQRAQRFDTFVQQHETHRQAAQTRLADARAQAEGEPYHTLWETRGTGEKVAIGIGLILGGVSWNANHVNRGIQILDEAMRLDLETQRAKHGELWKAVDEAAAGIRELDANELHDLTRFQAAEGAKWDAVASRLNAAIAANKGKGDIATAKKVALDANDKANAAWEAAIKTDAIAKHTSAQDKLLEEQAKTQESVRRRNEAAAKYNERRTSKEGKGGTVGGGGTHDTAITAMQTAADKDGATLGTIIIAGKGLPRKDAERLAKDMLAAKTRGDNLELKHTEADAAKTVHWRGRDYLAPKSNDVKNVAKDLANMDKYNDLIKEVSEDIRKNGFIVDPGGTDNPQTEAGKRRMSLMAEVQALGRQISALQATDAGQKLEGQMIGHAGVGFKPGTASPAALEELRHRALKLVNTKLGAMLTPADKGSPFSFEGGGGPRGPVLPAGAIPGTKGGKRGYQLNGVFHTTADITL